MREKIERTICDQCGTVHEFFPDTFGGRQSNHFTLWIADKRNRATNEKHFCDFKCLSAWVEKTRRAEAHDQD